MIEKKVSGMGRNMKSPYVPLTKEIAKQAGLEIGDLVQVYVNSRKEVCIRKVTK